MESILPHPLPEPVFLGREPTRALCNVPAAHRCRVWEICGSWPPWITMAGFFFLTKGWKRDRRELSERVSGWVGESQRDRESQRVRKSGSRREREREPTCGSSVCFQPITIPRFLSVEERRDLLRFWLARSNLKTRVISSGKWHCFEVENWERTCFPLSLLPWF